LTYLSEILAQNKAFDSFCLNEMFSTDTVIQSENLLLFDILKIRRNILSVCTPEYDFYEDLSLIRGLMAIMLDKELEC
jgi:hypothetical protein